MLDLLLKNIEEARAELGVRNVLFRGHSSVNYKLLPSVLRYDRKVDEVNLFYDYKTHAAAINGKSKSNWELLLDMQHYGLPTRLLDWSDSLGVALYFALEKSPDSPCIWLLNPYGLSLKSTKKDIIYDVSTVSDLGGHAGFNMDCVINGTSGFEFPYAIRPPHGNSRISAQRGLFTVHTSSRLPLEETCPEVVRKVDIPKEMIGPLKSYLSNLGIDEYSLFPDQQGLAGYLKSLHRL